MKNIISALGLAFLIIVFSVSCKKNNNGGGSSTKPVLTLSSSSVKRNQPLVASTNVISSNLVVRWSVNAAANNSWISPSGNKSIILFSNSGSYTVTASYFADSAATTPYDSSTSPVTVTDSIYNDSSGTWANCNSYAHVPTASSDQIFLTPVSYSDTGLVFVAHTQQTYGDQYPLLDYGPIPDTISASGYGFVFGTVTESPCNIATGTPTPATAILSISSLMQGANDFTIFFNGAVYEGTITVTNTQISFSWHYTSGIIISPMTIMKQ